MIGRDGCDRPEQGGWHCRQAQGCSAHTKQTGRCVGAVWPLGGLPRDRHRIGGASQMVTPPLEPVGVGSRPSAELPVLRDQAPQRTAAPRGGCARPWRAVLAGASQGPVGRGHIQLYRLRSWLWLGLPSVCLGGSCQGCVGARLRRRRISPASGYCPCLPAQASRAQADERFRGPSTWPIRRLAARVLSINRPRPKVASSPACKFYHVHE